MGSVTERRPRKLSRSESSELKVTPSHAHSHFTREHQCQGHHDLGDRRGRRGAPSIYIRAPTHTSVELPSRATNPRDSEDAAYGPLRHGGAGAALLTGHVVPALGYRQWVLSFSGPLAVRIGYDGELLPAASRRLAR